MLINKHILAAIAKCRASDQGRFAIDGVMVDGKNGLVVATDGRKLAVARTEPTTEEGFQEQRILSGQALNAVARSEFINKANFNRKSKPKDENVELAVQGKHDITIKDDTGIKAALLSEGVFPKWEMVVPTSLDGPVLALGISHLEDLIAMAKAGNKLYDSGGSGDVLYLYLPKEDNQGKGIGFSVCNGNINGVVMPVVPRDELKDWEGRRKEMYRDMRAPEGVYVAAEGAPEPISETVPDAGPITACETDPHSMESNESYSAAEIEAMEAEVARLESKQGETHA
jgi:hypothetical protein